MDLQYVYYSVCVYMCRYCFLFVVFGSPKYIGEVFNGCLRYEVHQQYQYMWERFMKPSLLNMLVGVSWHLIGRICSQRLNDTQIAQIRENTKNNSSKQKQLHMTYEEDMPDVISTAHRKDSLSIPADTGEYELS